MRWRNISRRSVMRRIYAARTLVLYWLIVIVCTAARPFISLRLGTFDASRVGHFVSETDLALSIWGRHHRHERGRRWLLYVMPRDVCNEQLRIMYMRTLRTLEGVTLIDERESHLARLLIEPIRLLEARSRQGSPVGAFHCGSPISGGLDAWGLTDSGRPFIAFTNDEAETAWHALKPLGITPGQPYVCLHVRDSAYLEQALPGMEWDYHNYRNPPPSTYVQAIRKLCDLGYIVVRMGKHASMDETFTSAGALDYTTFAGRSDLLDVFLYANCSFVISGSASGIDQLGTAFQKPTLITNLIPFTESRYAVSPLVIVPALLRWKNTNVLLPLSQMLANRWGRADQYASREIEIVYNSGDEILAAVVEFHELIREEVQGSPTVQPMQSTFWRWADLCGIADLTPAGAAALGRARGNISATFLEKHSHTLLS